MAENEVAEIVTLGKGIQEARARAADGKFKPTPKVVDDSAMDAVLTRLEAGESAQEVQRTPVKPTAKVDDDKSTDPQADASTREPVVESDVDGTAETPSGPVGDTEYDSAVSSLKRDGWKDDELAELSKAAVLRMGRARAKNQQDVDAAYEKLRASETKQAESEKAAVATPIAASPTLAKAREKLTEALGDEGAAAVLELLGAAVGPVQTQTEAMHRAHIEQQEESARQGLKGVVPEIQDPAEWAKVRKLARAFGESGEYATIASAIEAAARARYADFRNTTTRAEANKSRAKANGQPTRESVATKEQTLTKEQVPDKVLALLESGHSAAEVRRMLKLPA